jgi:hypothetical protein
MDFYKIGALKVFADIGALIDEDEKNQVKFMDLPTDIIQNNMSKYLLEDKQINKIFNEKDDYYLLNMLFGYIPNLQYIGPNTWNEYKTSINLDCIKNYVNSRSNFCCDELKVKYLVSKQINYQAFVINVYHDENKLGYINRDCRIEICNKKDDRLYRKGLSFISNRQRRKEGTFCASELAGIEPTPPAPVEQGK